MLAKDTMPFVQLGNAFRRMQGAFSQIGPYRWNRAESRFEKRSKVMRSKIRFAHPTSQANTTFAVACASKQQDVHIWKKSPFAESKLKTAQEYAEIWKTSWWCTQVVLVPYGFNTFGCLITNAAQNRSFLWFTYIFIVFILASSLSSLLRQDSLRSPCKRPRPSIWTCLRLHLREMPQARCTYGRMVEELRRQIVAECLSSAGCSSLCVNPRDA